MTQKERIRKHLLMGRKLTSLQALKMFGCFRLASRVSELRLSDGMDVLGKMIKTRTGKYVKQYWFEK